MRPRGELVHVRVPDGSVVVAAAEQLQAVVPAAHRELGQALGPHALRARFVQRQRQLTVGVAQQVEDVLVVDLRREATTRRVSGRRPGTGAGERCTCTNEQNTSRLPGLAASCANRSRTARGMTPAVADGAAAGA